MPGKISQIAHLEPEDGQNFEQLFGGEYPGYDLSRGDVNILLCVYVLPEYKNKGIGAAAMEYMEQLKPSAKWILDTPAVSLKNKRFYEKCGNKDGGKTRPNHISQIYSKGFDE